MTDSPADGTPAPSPPPTAEPPAPTPEPPAPPPAPPRAKRPRSTATRWIRRALAWFGLLVLLSVVAFTVFFFWASGGDSYSETPEPAPIVLNPAGSEPPPVAAGSPLELGVITFNIGYARGPAGDESGPWTADLIRANLVGIADQIRDAGADLAFLQEVDFESSRSHDIDEARFILERLGWRHAACAVTWEKNYVPFPYWPPSRHYGAMKSGQCLLSRYPITEATRVGLPRPDSMPWWRKRFYLQRAVLHAVVKVGDVALDVFDVHLEAFDNPNRMDHARRLAVLVDAVQGDRVIVAGDFNALPPEARQKSGFVDEPEMNFEHDETIAIARGMARVAEVLPDEPAFTFPADGATRRLDYIFHRPGLAKLSARVLAATPGPWSDHLPVAARFRVVP